MFEINELHLPFLLKALLTLKFECDAETAAEYCGSPYIAELCNRLYDEWIVLDERRLRDGPARRREWAKKLGTERSLETARTMTGRTIEVKAFYDHLRVFGQANWWRNISLEEKNDYVCLFMSPYTVDDGLLQSLVVEADKLAASLP